MKLRFRVEAERSDWSRRHGQMLDWLLTEVGLDRQAVHADSLPGIHCFAVYLEDAETARRLVEAVGMTPILLSGRECAVLLG